MRESAARCCKIDDNRHRERERERDRETEREREREILRGGKQCKFDDTVSGH